MASLLRTSVRSALALSLPVHRSLSTAAATQARPWRFDVPRDVAKAQYAVRGRIPQRAEMLQAEGVDVIFCNIGNPQARNVDQVPITFPRQVLSLVENPHLLANPPEDYPADVIIRARQYADNVRLGAYSESQGAKIVRESVERLIRTRDKIIPNPDDIFITAGASEGIKLLLRTLIHDSSSGIMIPIPQYPLYTAEIALAGGTAIPYYLDESNGWDLPLPELANAVTKANEQFEKEQDAMLKENPYHERQKLDARALCVINPGNPTGQVLEWDTIVNIIEFAYDNDMMILADEVYQENVHMDSKEFHSFRKVLNSMSPEIANGVPLVSFHSTSKGVFGECGRRGGYMELVNFDQGFQQQILKLASISLCPNVAGQLMVAMMCQPPMPLDPSFELYQSECDAIKESLKRRSQYLHEELTSCPGITCSDAMGAMYLFPKISLSQAAIDAAANFKLEGDLAAKLGSHAFTPDEYYCWRLLEEQNLCVVPGSGFKQAPDTYHFRTTFLPFDERLTTFATRFKAFQNNWIDEFGMGL
eukprot:m.253297 g.253297  ORF g.253297 m.253297 type:complete len:533 (+) comp15483_c1_seq1:4448-6046(+)